MIVAHGSRVRDLTCGPDVADKDIIIAIVDGVDSPGAPLELTEDDAARARRRAGERERR